MDWPLQVPSVSAPGVCAVTWDAYVAGRARYKRKKADQAAAAAEQSHDVPQSREDADKEAKRLKRWAGVWCHCTALAVLCGRPHSCGEGGARVTVGFTPLALMCALHTCL